MLRREFVGRVAGYGLIGAATTGLSGCGTIFHKERLGQPHSNQIDWCVAAADGLGLLLFFIPGVIAFVVDFYTGAIYLPCDYCASTEEGAAIPPGPDGAPAATPTVVAASGGVEFARIEQPREQLDPRSIETAVIRHVGKPIALVEGDARVSELAALDQFAEQRRRHDKNRGFGTALRNLLTWRSAA